MRISMSMHLTDHQTPIFESVFIDLQRLEVKLEDDTLPNSGWVSLSINPGVYNILRFRNGLDTLFATGTLPNARVKKIKLVLVLAVNGCVGGGIGGIDADLSQGKAFNKSLSVLNIL